MPSSPLGQNPAEPPCPGPKPAGAFRVIHTADWHLGKAFGDLDRTEEHRRFLDFLLTTILATQTDALVIAGDVFDSATPPQSAVRLYFDFLAALHRQSDCAVVVTAGNHDSPGHLDSPRDLLRVINVRVLASLPDNRAEALIPLPTADAPRLLVAAVPFLRERDLRTGHLGQSAQEIQRDLQEGLKDRYREMAAAAQPWIDAGTPILATGHLTALGATASESEREIHVGGLGAIGADAFPKAFAYVALGHLHRPQAVGGNPRIRYSGSPIALSFSEASDRKEIRVLDFVGNSLSGHACLPVPPARHLVALRIPYAELDANLRAFVPPASALLPWVEVVIEDAPAGEDLYKRVRDAVEGQPFEVVCVRVERAGGIAALGLDDGADVEGMESLLADPKKVFERRLEQEPALADDERLVLTTAFSELCGVLADRQAGEGGVAR